MDDKCSSSALWAPAHTHPFCTAVHNRLTHAGQCLSFLDALRLGFCWAVLAPLGRTSVQAARSPPRRPGDPPRVAARDLYEYRHLQLYNPDYIKWVNDNIHDVPYDRRPGAVELGWDQLAQKAAGEEPAVVMVTQATVSRLLALQLAMKEWNGPVAMTIYVEFPERTVEAARCVQQVTQYLQQQIQQIWPTSAASPAVSVSYMFTPFHLSRASCNVPMTENPEVEHGQTRATSEFVTDHTQSTRFGRTRTPNYILRRFSHSLLSTAASPVDDPGGDPSLSPAWHFHPRSKYHDVPIGSRPWQEEYAEFYPVNALRNLAWSRVLHPPAKFSRPRARLSMHFTGPVHDRRLVLAGYLRLLYFQVPSGAFVFLNDIDFLPTPHLHKELVAGRWKAELRRMRSAFFQDGEREALVVPAFERLSAKASKGQAPKATPWTAPCRRREGCEMVNGMALPRSFDMLRTMLQKETFVDIFHRKQFFPGHGCYSWLTWLQTETPEEMLPMEYSNPCEPYVIALSDAMPRYDERFRGRGQNKVEQLTHMAMWGFQWRLLPGHFVLHVPHASTASAQGGWDAVTTPLVLMKLKIDEVEKEHEFKTHVVQAVPVPVF